MTISAITDVLGGSKVLRRKVQSETDLRTMTREGVPVETLPVLARELSIERNVLARVVGISDRTLSRRLATSALLSAEESDRIVRLSRIIALARETLGTTAKASLWLQSPNRALDGQLPLDLLDTDTGVRSVETILGRIAYGIYS